MARFFLLSGGKIGVLSFPWREATSVLLLQQICRAVQVWCFDAIAGERLQHLWQQTYCVVSGTDLKFCSSTSEKVIWRKSPRSIPSGMILWMCGRHVVTSSGWQAALRPFKTLNRENGGPMSGQSTVCVAIGVPICCWRRRPGLRKGSALGATGYSAAPSWWTQNSLPAWSRSVPSNVR